MKRLIEMHPSRRGRRPYTRIDRPLKHPACERRRRSGWRKRLIAGALAVVSSGLLLPYAWQGVGGVMAYFAALRSDVSTLKIEQAQLKGQVSQIQSDLEVILGRQLQGVAQGNATPADPD